MGESGSVARDGSTSQLPQAVPAEAAAESQCFICLEDIKKTACMTFHMHCFCIACIQW